MDEHSFATDESQLVVGSPVSTTPPPKPVDAAAETLSTFSSSDEADAGGGAEAAGGGGGRKVVMEIHKEGAPPMMQCHGAHGEGYRRWQEESGGGGRVVGVEVKGRAETA
jgi:hypothetical protein